MGVSHTPWPQESHRRPFHVVQRGNPTLARVRNTMAPIPRRRRLGILASLVGGLLGRRLRAYEIRDHSMRPTLADGDWVICLKRPRRIRPGDIVVVEHPERRDFDLVKRVSSIGSDGIVVLGDDPGAGSIDSVTFGPVSPGNVEARALLRYRPFPPRTVR